MRLSSITGHLLLEVIFFSRSSSIKACLHRRSGHYLPKVLRSPPCFLKQRQKETQAGAELCQAESSYSPAISWLVYSEAYYYQLHSPMLTNMVKVVSIDKYVVNTQINHHQPGVSCQIHSTCQETSCAVHHSVWLDGSIVTPRNKLI